MNDPSKGSAPLTGGFESIVEWSATLPLWQQDALRRIATNGSVSESDIASLTSYCCPPATLPGVLREPPQPPIPLASSHIRHGAKDTSVSLHSIRDVKGVNAVAPGQALTFRTSGLTIIFGNNGAGKSGYARVLKSACRARHVAEILPNVYESDSGSASARLEYIRGGNTSKVQWTLGQVTDPVLSSISVFDAQCAPIHVDGKNDLAYVPAPLEVLQSLAESCGRVKDALGAEEKALQQQKSARLSAPKARPHTSVGKLLAGLSRSTQIGEFKKLAGLGPAESARLTALRSDLAADPKKSALKSAQAIDVLERHRARLSNVQEVASSKAFERLAFLMRDSATKSAAAGLAAKQLFARAPLPGIGSDVWRALWEAARKYSSEAAYKGFEFPVVTDAKCPLCQQSLTDEAADRMTSFEAFVKGETQSAARLATEGLARARTVLQSRAVGADEAKAILDWFAAADLETAQLDQLEQFLDISAERLAAALSAQSPEELGEATPLPSMPEAILLGLSTRLGKRLKDLQAASEDEGRKKLIAELEDLEDRGWLGEVIGDVEAEVARLSRLHTVQESMKSTGTTRISAKSSELAELLVTDTLRDRFAKELHALELGRLRLELVKAGAAKGNPRFRVALIAKPDAPLGKVLSEGEHRCLALAAFLAELATQESRCGIVFDDPVSSLDHEYRNLVARRLVAEAKVRQVIIFTHDIVFFTQLDQHARAGKVEVSYQSVTRGEDASGYCSPEIPNSKRPVLDALGAVEGHLQNVSILHRQGQDAKWWKEAKGVAGDLRDLWERAVETVISPVYSRFEWQVDTKGLIELTVLQPSDCETMRKAFGRCSELQHSTSGAVGALPPKPAELENEIRVLKEWLVEIGERQKKARQSA